jgi:hypothetical protein
LFGNLWLLQTRKKLSTQLCVGRNPERIIFQSTRLQPAMAAGVTDHLWDAIDLVRMIEVWEAKQ